MKFAKPGPEEGTPTIDRCLAHRCAQHEHVPMLNMNESTEAECGACIGLDTWRLEREVLFPILDAYAARLTHHAVLREKLREARVRLELVQPGAGDFLSDDDLGDSRT